MKLRTGRILPFLAAGVAALAATAVIDSSSYLDEVKYLASPELKGRLTGSPELEKAAGYLRAKYESFGLQPVGGSFEQAFQVTTDAKLGEKNRFTFTENGKTITLNTSDFVPFNFSQTGKLAGAVVFAGYGITAPEYNYDDYAGLDVKGKVVLVLRHEPQESDANSIFEGKTYTQHAQFASKASNAKMHGASGVILVNDRANHPSAADELEKFGITAGPTNAGIPFVQVKEERVDQWFADAGKPLAQIQASIDKDLKPQSFAFPASIHVDANLDVERAVKTVHNVLAYRQGETPEYIIIGGHYDHLGPGGQYSLAPSQTGTTHPGADDNASGAVGVVELARWFSREPKAKRGILFMNFAGEEQGLLGSAYYADHPLLPLKDAVAMINLDMIGRMRDHKLYLGGTASGSTFKATVEKALAGTDLKVDYSGGTSEGSSDHTSFTSHQVPALFFFSGLHSDYHKPSDTWEKIDGAAAAKVLQLVAEVAQQLRDAPGRPEFVKAVPTNPHGSGDSGNPGPVSGYGPYFGSVPDFAEGINGVKFADVREGSPAAKAGLKQGDIMVEFDGKVISNLYDFTYALRGKKPGDEVTVNVMRDGKPLTVKCTLSRRE
ncbi:MAG TPA: M28 family peptidase [Candidatus Solibacter sp.]|nr:M28 family peptidase [Candidatus Solibacter sp.]